ncbi:hypothetical protein ACFQOY_10005 [Enterococcus alcedinis]
MIYSIEMLLTLTKSMELSIEKRIKLDYDYMITNTFETVTDTSDSLKHNISKILLPNYLALVKGKIMPDEFWYNESLQSGVIELILKMPDNPGLNSAHFTSEEQYSVIRSLLYSNHPVSSLIRKFENHHLDFNEPYYYLKYRDMYNKDFFVEKNSYFGDPYSCLTDTKYILSTFSKMLREERTKHHYLFYSMFDLDFFTRKNYFTNNTKDSIELIEYAITRIDKIFKNDLSLYEEKAMREKMIRPLFSSLDSTSSIEYVSLFESHFWSYLNKMKKIKNIEFETEMDNFIVEYESGNKLKPEKYKNFIRNYKKVYAKWPKDKAINPQRLEELCEKSNKRKITDGDRKMIEVLNSSRR